MMIAKNNFHFEINTIHIENMINQLNQGKTARGKIAADNVIIQPQPRTDNERGVNPAHLVVELKKLLNILYQIPTILPQTPKPILSRLHGLVWSSLLSRGVTQGSQEHRTRRRGTSLNTLYFNTEQRSRDTGTHTNDVKTRQRHWEH